MTGQRVVSRMNLSLATLENQRGDCLWVVPPDEPGYATEELKGGDHAFEDRLGALEGKREHERCVE